MTKGMKSTSRKSRSQVWQRSVCRWPPASGPISHGRTHRLRDRGEVRMQRCRTRPSWPREGMSHSCSAKPSAPSNRTRLRTRSAIGPTPSGRTDGTRSVAARHRCGSGRTAAGCRRQSPTRPLRHRLAIARKPVGMHGHARNKGRSEPAGTDIDRVGRHTRQAGCLASVNSVTCSRMDVHLEALPQVPPAQCRLRIRATADQCRLGARPSDQRNEG